MALVRDYVNQKLARIGLSLSEEEITLLLSTHSADDATTCDDAAGVTTAKQMLVDIIPELLLMPDVTEGGMSIKRDRTAIAKYYGLLCSELGIVNRLDAPAETPTVSDCSYLW